MPRCRRPGSRLQRSPRRTKPRWSWSNPPLEGELHALVARASIATSRLTTWTRTGSSIAIGARVPRAASTAAKSWDVTGVADRAGLALAAAEVRAADAGAVVADPANSSPNSRLQPPAGPRETDWLAHADLVLADHPWVALGHHFGQGWVRPDQAGLLCRIGFRVGRTCSSSVP